MDELTAARRLLAGVTLAGLLVAAGATAPSITITHVPAFGSHEDLSGTVSGVDVSQCYIVVYLSVAGGWWVKPATAPASRTAIQPDTSWVTDVTTGGIDNEAVEYLVALMPNSAGDPPDVLGAPTLPASLFSAALATLPVTRPPYARTVSFAGRTWGVKASSTPVGPGPNRFSDLPADIWVDSAGLHLSVRFHDGQWWCTEVVLLESLGHGTYSFQTASRVDTIDPNITVGLFTWDNHGDWAAQPAWPYREIDFEYSRWGWAGDPANAQFVVQPYTTPGNLRRFRIDLTDASPELTSFWEWRADRIHFTSLLGHHTPFIFPPASVIDEWTWTLGPVPDEGRENVRFNLWLNNPSGPANGQSAEVLITDFQYFAPGVTPAALSVLEAN